MAGLCNCSRSVRLELKLGLALDGVKPFSTQSTCDSTWFVMTLIYNLPHWLVTKNFVMLSLIILRKKSTTSDNIDVHMWPLCGGIEGIVGWCTRDGCSKTSWRKLIYTRGMLINDFPVYGLISGCVPKYISSVQFVVRTSTHDMLQS